MTRGEVGRQRQQKPEQHESAQFGQRQSAAVPGELDAALEADGEQQDRAHELVDRAGQAKVGARDSREQPEHEEQDDRVDRWHVGALGAPRDVQR